MQLIAWNGGGKDNYTDIVAGGKTQSAWKSHGFEL